MKRFLCIAFVLSMLLAVASCQPRQENPASDTSAVQLQNDGSSGGPTESAPSATQSTAPSANGSSVSSVQNTTAGRHGTTTTRTVQTTTTSPEVTAEPMNAKDAAARINDNPSAAITKIKSERVQVAPYDPNWAYCHHAGGIWFKGKYYVSWSNGRIHEDDLGQRVMYATSSDFYHWSEPKPLVDSMQGLYSENYLFGCGFYTDGETLIAYFRRSEYSPDCLENNGTTRPLGRPATNLSTSDTGMYYLTSTDGENWSDPIRFPVEAGAAEPRVAPSGRVIFAGGTMIGYTDDLTGLTGWKSSFIPTNYLNDAYDRGARMLGEGSFYQTRDMVTHFMMRSNTGYVWHSESYDNGVTWSEVYPTNFHEDNTMSRFGNLPDGRAYYVGTPLFTGTDTRSPLMLCVSDDGYNFDQQFILRDEDDYKMQKWGYAKGGYYGYPETFIHDGYLYVVYSRMKEVMEITRVAIADIDNASAHQALDFSVSSAKWCYFDTEQAVESVKAVGDTVISFDRKEAAMKITNANKDAASLQTPGTFEIGTAAQPLFDGVATEEYPVLAIMVKKSGYSDVDMGPQYWSTTGSAARGRNWVQYKSPDFAVSDDWQMIIIDMSFEMSYYDAAIETNLPLFTGNWTGIQIGFPKRNTSTALYTDGDDAFWVKWVAAFKSVKDAQTYAAIHR